jgi:hypothetical protein
MILFTFFNLTTSKSGQRTGVPDGDYFGCVHYPQAQQHSSTPPAQYYDAEEVQQEEEIGGWEPTTAAATASYTSTATNSQVLQQVQQTQGRSRGRKDGIVEWFGSKICFRTCRRRH